MKTVKLPDGFKIKEMTRPQMKAMKEAGADPVLVSEAKTAIEADAINEKFVDFVIDPVNGIYTEDDLKGLSNAQLEELASLTYRESRYQPAETKN